MNKVAGLDISSSFGGQIRSFESLTCLSQVHGETRDSNLSLAQKKSHFRWLDNQPCNKAFIRVTFHTHQIGNRMGCKHTL